MVSFKVDDPRNQEQVAKAILAPISAKVPNHSKFLSSLIAQACINSTPDNVKNFDIDNIRVIHILGSALEDSTYISGFLVKRNVEGTIDRMVKPRIAVFSCPLDTQQAETKGTVLIQNANKLLTIPKESKIWLKNSFRSWLMLTLT